KEGGISYTSRARENYLLNFFDNYNETKSESDFEGRYLIITAPTYENSLTNFANYKRNIGFEVNLASTNTTGTSASDIKTYLQNQYNSATTRPDFVLLVGDHEDIPASGGNSSGGDKNDPITDLNYARLAGDDYFADVFIGRFSVSSPNELFNLIRKTTHMEMNMHLLDKTAKFLAGSESNGWMESQFEMGHNHVVKNTFNPQGYSSQKLYQPTIEEVVNALSDNPLFYIYSGHGYFDQISGGSFTLNLSRITSATNTVFPFGFSFACKTGNYAYATTCFGEHWIRSQRGGVTYFGSSVTTFVNSDKAIEKKIFGDAFIDKDHIAAITNLGMKRYWQRFWSWSNRTRTKRYMKAYNLLGDPSLNKNGVRVLTVPVICGPTTVKVKNPHQIPVSWSATGNYSLSNHTDTSVIVTPTGLNTGVITVVFQGLASVSENLITCNLSISGPTTVCTSNTTFTLNNLPAGSTVSWSHSSNLAYVSGQGTPGFTVKATSLRVNGAGWVQALVSTACGSDTVANNVWVGTPPSAQPVVDYQNGLNVVCQRYAHTAEVPAVEGVTEYQWRLLYPDGFSWPLSSTSRIASFCVDTVGYFTIGVKQRMEGCGWSGEAVKSFWVEACGGGGDCGQGGIIVPKLIVSPNPTSYEFTIAEVEPANDNIPWVLRLMSQQGAVMVNVTATLPKTLSVQNLQPGVYVLHARQGHQSEQQVIVVR
ncbi:MAG: C25 family cysteine peptidase, partial [Tenuifilaceae bacterium]|nr:C25 family cysteine peptidase [Tenuifilaceae bacterium]